MTGPFARLGIGLQAEAEFLQQTAHQLLAGGETLLGQRHRQFLLALADPKQWRLRITADRRLHQFVQGLENPWLLLGRWLSAGTFPTNPFAEPHSTGPEIMEAAADRAARNPGGLRDCRYPSPASGAGFTGREQAPIPLVQERLNGVKTGLDGGGC